MGAQAPLLVPNGVDDELFERSPHRADLPATYNRYMPLAPDTPHLDEMLLLRPLFGTSFLIEDFLRTTPR